VIEYPWQPRSFIIGHFLGPAQRGQSVSKPPHLLATIDARWETPMPKFVIEREVPGAGNLSDAQLREISQKSAF